MDPTIVDNHNPNNLVGERVKHVNLTMECVVMRLDLVVDRLL